MPLPDSGAARRDAAMRSAVSLLFVASPGAAVSEGFWPALLIVVFVILWVAAKVFDAVRKSERQWREVDKSKLKEWEDDEEEDW